MNILIIPSGGIDPVDQPGKADTLHRLEAGIEAWNSGQFHYILVCGGIFNPPTVQTKPAAQIMKEWLVAHGVNESLIQTEASSLDTFENARLSRRLLGQKRTRVTAVTICTEKRHASRFILAWKATGSLIPIKQHDVLYPLSLSARFNEWLMRHYHRLDPCGRGWIARRNRAKRRQTAQS